MYLMGVPVPTIMSISGHKTQKSFMSYIKATGEEHAQIMMKIWKDNPEKREKPGKKVKNWLERREDYWALFRYRKYKTHVKRGF